MALTSGYKKVGKCLGRLLLILCIGIGVTMIGCRLEPPQGRTQSVHLSAAETQLTTLGQVVNQEQAKHPDLSGLYLLADPHEAFAARVKLAKQAEKTLDVQYYIWRDDTTGTLLMEALHEAAERGVRVRLLIDDHGTSGLDEALSAMDAHPNIEVRLFNPFVFRPFKLFGFVTEFDRANRRMHNKSFTADNAATIVGGRNVGDEYFGATDGVLFADLDALAVGDVVPKVSQSFDDYWQSGSVYALSDVVPPINAEQQKKWSQHTSIVKRSPAANEYVHAIANMGFVQQLIDGQLPLDWAPTRFIVDSPSKGLAKAKHQELLISHLEEVLGKPQQSLDLVSPYFVPTKAGTDYFIRLQQQGVKVRILTNSLAATDVVAVHSGYARYRQRLVEAGVELYELKPTSNNLEDKKYVGFKGSSGSSLHAKTFGTDQNHMFIGSFNFDPRSINLNTELGIVVENPHYRQKMSEVFSDLLPQRSWRVQYDSAQQQLLWTDATQTPPQVLTEEPMSTWWQRASVAVMSVLPIEGFL